VIDILAISSKKKNAIKMIAGGGFEPPTIPRYPLLLSRMSKKVKIALLAHKKPSPPKVVCNAEGRRGRI
jgi:hypothetical protein